MHIFVAVKDAAPMSAPESVEVRPDRGLPGDDHGDVTLIELELCEPCGTFAKRTRREALRFFVHKGGLHARIVEGGAIRVGDPVG
jgi:hypothetical protein